MERSRLLERDDVLDRAKRVVDAARTGQAGSLFVVGEAGLGKTSVLDWAAAYAGADLVTATGRGDEMESGLPFGLLTQVFGTLGLGAEELAGGPLGHAIEPAAPHHRALRLLERRLDAPLLVLLDDLHWADDDSLDVIAFLARRLQSLPVSLIAVLRPWPDAAYSMARRLVGSGHAELHRLQPLSPAGAATLLEARVHADVDEPTQRRAWALGQGNPLLVEQLALALVQGEGLPDLGGASAVVANHVLLARFAALDRTTMAYVQAASVLGIRFHPEIAADASELERRDVDHALEVLFRSGLITEDAGGELRFTHPLLSQALYEDLAPPRRRRLHARCAELLDDRGLETEASEHAIRAGVMGDQRVRALLERTGRLALATGAVITATRHLGAAVRLWGDRPPAGLVLTLCRAMSASGRMADAADTSQALLATGALAWEEQVAALRLLGRARYLTGSSDHGEAAMTQAIDLAAAHDPAAAVGPLLDQSLAAWLAEGPARALPLAARARELASGAAPAVRERAEATWGHLAYEAGDSSGLQATEPIGAALEDPSDSHLVDPADLSWPWAALYQVAMNANYAGRYEASERAFGLAAHALEQAGAVNALANVDVHLANVAIRRGHLGQALHHAARAEEFSDLTPTVLPYAQLARAEALAWAGRFEESEASCRRAEAEAGEQWFAQLWLAYVRGMRHVWQGDKDASDMFLAAERLTNDAGVREPCHVQWQAHAVAAHVAAGRYDDGVRVVAWLQGAAATLPCSWPSAAASLGQARLAAGRGDDAEADARYREALTRLDGAQLPLQHADALLAFGSHLRRQGRPADARRHLRDALDLAQASGATHLAAEAQAELLAAGGRRRARAQEGGLTPAELRVARHAASGMSNTDIARALYLSVNTVETHLKRVFAKLGISSRRQLMGHDLPEAGGPFDESA